MNVENKTKIGLGKAKEGIEMARRVEELEKRVAALEGLVQEQPNVEEIAEKLKLLKRTT